MTTAEKHSLRSSEREEYLEYIFLAQLCSYGWSIDQFVEVSRAQTDAHGYDVVLSCGDVTRHVQLKASVVSGRARSQKINLALTRKPSGCVVWMKIDPDSLQPTVFGWLGEDTGRQLTDLGSKVSKHTKANSEGKKAKRENLRDVSWSRFEEIDNIRELFCKLFDNTITEEKKCQP